MRRLLVLTAVLALGLAGPARADGPLRQAPEKRPPRGWRDPLRYRDLLAAGVDRVRHVEFVEMLAAVLSGSQMGPNEGWFKPSQSRYGWEWLAKRHGVSPAGAITRKQFQGPAEFFDRLDRDRDGRLTADDFDWSERSAFARMSIPSTMWFRTYDADSNGRLSAAEWEAIFRRASKGKGYLTAEDLREAFPVAPPRQSGPPPKKGGGGPSPLVLVKGLFQGELGSPFPGPSVGSLAPDFTLPTQDHKGKVTLSKLRGKPVVLVFGSFT